jgi:hypothetical protein
LPHQKSPVCPPTGMRHEREADGTKQDKCRDHRQTFFSSPPTVPNPGHATTAEKFKLRHYRIFRAIGFEPTGLGPQPFAEHHAAEVKRWVAFMTETGMRK